MRSTYYASKKVCSSSSKMSRICQFVISLAGTVSHAVCARKLPADALLFCLFFHLLQASKLIEQGISESAQVMLQISWAPEVLKHKTLTTAVSILVNHAKDVDKTCTGLVGGDSACRNADRAG